MNRRVVALIAFFCVGLAASAEGRQWEYKGKKFEAEIAYFESGYLWMIKADGSLNGFRLSEFSPADRKFAEAWLEKHEGGPIGETIEASATGLRRVIRFRDDAVPPEPVVTAVLRLRGKPAATATQFHGLKFHVETDDGRKPELSYGRNGIPGGDVTISRGKFYYSPDWGFQTKIEWLDSTPPLKGLRRLQGSLMVTTGRPESFVFDDINLKPDRKIEHRLLEQAGLRATLNPSGNMSGAKFGEGKQPSQFKVFFDGPKHRVFAIELLDRGGEPIENSVPMTFGSSVVDNGTGAKTEDSTYLFLTHDVPPEKLQLKITVLLDVREIPVTFEIENLEFGPKS